MTDRSVNYRFTGNFTNLTAGLTTAGRNVSELGTRLTALDRNGRQMRSGLKEVGDAAGKVGLVAAVGLTAAVAASANFEKSMSAVQAATHETAGNMARLSDAAIKAGADTVYSASEAAGAIEELAKAGVSTTDILNGGLTGALNLASAGAIEVADAAEIAATAMTQFKLGGDQVNHVADLLAAGAGKAQGGVDDLGMALKQSGLVAAQTGLSIEETTGALAEFAANGLIGSDAGTAFKTMLQALTPSSQQAADAMDALGISAYDTQGNFIGMEKFAGKLQDGLKSLAVEQQNATLKTIFGSDAVRAAAIIFKDGAKGVAEWQGKVNDSGYAALTAATRLDNLAGDMEQFKGSLETALIGAGEGSQGPLRSLVQGATDAVNVFNKLPGPVKGTTTALLAVTAVTGGGLFFGAKVINGIAAARAAMVSLGLASNATSISLGAVARSAGLAGAAVAGFYLANQSQKEDTSARVGKFEAALVGVADGAKGAKSSLDDLFNDNRSGFKKFLTGSSSVDSLKDALRTMGPGLAGFSAGLSDAADVADHAFKKIDSALAGMVADGNGETAGKAFAFIEEQAKKAGVSTESLAKAFPEYLAAVDGAANATTNAAGATDQLGGAQSAAAQQTAQMTKALEDSRKAATDQAEAFFTVGNSLNDAKVSLNDWIKDMRKQAEALRDFRVNAETAAKKGLREGLIAELQKAGPEGALRMKQLANATKDQIREANRAWVSGQREIGKYTDAVGGVPKTVGTSIEVRTARALAAIEDVKRRMASIKDKNVALNYYVNQINGSNKPKNDTHSADGGTVPKTGQPYADRHPYMLADGEEVISNRRGQADRFRPLLKAINNAADGATVGYGPARDVKASWDQMNAMRGYAGAGTGIDYDRLASAVSGDRLLGYRGTRDAMVAAMRIALSEMPIQRVSRDVSMTVGAS